MQATITYLLSEQAQRAQMAATGQPVARKQIIIEDVPQDLITSPLASIDGAGVLSFDLARNTWITRQGNLCGIGGGYAVVYAPFELVPDSGLAAILLRTEQIAAKRAEITAQYREQMESQAAEKRAEADRKAAKCLAMRAERQPLIDAYLADPAQRLADEAYQDCVCIGGFTISQEVFGAESIQQLLDENRRRVSADKASKDAADAAKEAAKQAFFRTWITEHGTESQRARSAENLLCRDEAISALADATFAPLPDQRYTNASRPRPNCCCEECDTDAEGCAIKYDVEDSADCLNDAEYERYQFIRTAMPDAAYVLRTHTAIHDCAHAGGCKRGTNHGCKVKVTVGPFMLVREYEL